MRVKSVLECENNLANKDHSTAEAIRQQKGEVGQLHIGTNYSFLIGYVEPTEQSRATISKVTEICIKTSHTEDRNEFDTNDALNEQLYYDESNFEWVSKDYRKIFMKTKWGNGKKSSSPKQKKKVKGKKMNERKGDNSMNIYRK